LRITQLDLFLLNGTETSLTVRRQLYWTDNKIKPDYVVHLAVISFVTHGDVEAIYQTNVVGTRHLLDALATAAHKPQAVY
jgi:nucleoside-diphosphate-sugar epimerase